MPGHDARENLAITNELIRSTTNAEVLDMRRVWGIQYMLESAGAETRKVRAPSLPGQCIGLTMVVDGGDVAVTLEGNDAAEDVLTFSAVGQWVVIESFQVSPTSLQWRVTSKQADVTVT